MIAQAEANLAGINQKPPVSARGRGKGKGSRGRGKSKKSQQIGMDVLFIMTIVKLCYISQELSLSALEIFLHTSNWKQNPPKIIMIKI